MAAVRVLLVSHGLMDCLGGSAISEARLVHSLQSTCEVTVLCRANEAEPSFIAKHQLKHVITFHPAELITAYLYGEHWFNKLLASTDVVHVNGHWRWEHYLIAKNCVKRLLPYVVHPRGMYIVNDRRPVLKRAFNLVCGNFVAKRASKIIALSRFEIEQFQRYPVDADQVEVIPNGIDLDPGIDARAVSSLVAPPHEYFLYLGRISARKNLGFLIEAFAGYRGEGGTRGLRLMGPSEPKYLEEVKERIRSFGVENEVRIVEPAYGEEKWEAVARATAVIYPSVDEAFGRVPFEAILGGSAPIIPRKSGGAEYLEKFLPECVFEDGNLNSLVKVMQTVECDCVALESRGLVAARNWIKTDLNWEKIASRVEKLYESVLSQGQARTVQPFLSSVGH